MVDRRLKGEPLAWITGRVRFCGVVLRISPGVYVPRWHSRLLVNRAVRRLPAAGVLVDVCTGSGAIAAAVLRRRPDASVSGTDIDPIAVECARSNGVPVYQGNLLQPLPETLRGAVDLITATVPCVPTQAMATLQRDTFSFESELSYHGGADGLELVRSLLHMSTAWLRRGGAMLIALGGDQDSALHQVLNTLGFELTSVIRDSDGDLRGVECVLQP